MCPGVFIFLLWSVLFFLSLTDTRTSLHAQKYTDAQFAPQSVYFIFFIVGWNTRRSRILVFLTDINTNNISRAKMKPSCSVVCTSRWGNEPWLHLKKAGSEFRALMAQWKTLTVTRPLSKPQCKLNVPSAKQRFRLFRWRYETCCPNIMSVTWGEYSHSKTFGLIMCFSMINNKYVFVWLFAW